MTRQHSTTVPAIANEAGDEGDKRALPRVLSLWQVTMSGVGLVIGAGIYVLIGSAAAEAGNAVWLSFVVAALISAFTGLSYAELVSMYPSAAAEYEFGRQAFNELVGFLAGWAMFVAFVIAAATVAIGFGHYLQEFWSLDIRLAAAGLLVVLTVVVMIGLQKSIWLSLLLVVLQVTGLALVIVAGTPHIGDRDLLEGASIAGVLHGAALVFFAFIGFDDIATLSEETRNPSKTMPRALLLTLGISAVLYALVGLAAVSVVGGTGLAASKQPFADVLAHDWGGTAADIVVAIALAATVNTTLLILTAASRILYGIASRGSLPAVLARVSSRTSSPHVAAACVLAMTLCFVVNGRIDLVAAATDMAVYIVFILVNLSLIVLRFRQPGTARGFRVPGAIGRVPIIPVIAVATVVAMIVSLRPDAIAIGVGVVAFGVLAHVMRGAASARLAKANLGT